MKLGFFKLAAAAGLACASLAPAQAATFAVDMSNTSVDVTNYVEYGFTTFSASLDSGLSGVSFDLVNPGDSVTFDFIDLNIGGILGVGSATLEATLAFDPPGGMGSSSGDGFYIKGLFVTGGGITWDPIAPIYANGVTYEISFSDLSGLTISDPTVTATVTMISEVPEAATWALMIAGFGLVGTAMRLRRREDTALAA